MTRNPHLKTPGDVPYGYCCCGCGEQTRRAERNFYRLGVLKGEPFRYINGHGRARKGPLYEIDATGCWLWQLELERNGYGRKRVDGQKQGAHRWMYELLTGPIPEGHHLHHRCGVPACVNPDHLEVLTPQEHVRLERAKLTVAEVREIKRRVTDAYGSCAALAREFGVHPKTVNDIKLRKTWVDA